MHRVLALSLPGFSVDRILRHDRPPSSPPLLLLVATTHGTQRVAVCSTAAAKLGVRSGMSLAHARALIGERELALERFDPDGDRRALERLGTWALRFSPLVAAVDEGIPGLLFDVTGSGRLFGGEERLIDVVVEAVTALGFGARAATADTIGCALAVARFGARDRVRVPSGGESDALAPLPVAALRLEPETVDALVEVGVEKVAHLYELVRAELPARFGAHLLLRLDQARGAAFELFEPLRPAFPLQAGRELEAPVELGVVVHIVRELLGGLIDELRRRAEGAWRLELELTCAETQAVHETVVLSRPSRDFAHLWSLLEPRLERAHLGFGVERVVLAMPVTAPTPTLQIAPWKGPPAPRHPFDQALGELLDTLMGRLGRERILGVESVESHLPERAFRARPCLDIERSAGHAAPITPLVRPSRLFTPLDAVAVDTEKGGLPIRFRWQGETCEVVRHFGPERIESPWWIHGCGATARDYFRVEDRRGRWLWMGRGADGRWFVHGEWA